MALSNCCFLPTSEPAFRRKNCDVFKICHWRNFFVVIGILIALQINNWNDQRKAKELTQLYYNQLLEDF